MYMRGRRWTFILSRNNKSTESEKPRPTSAKLSDKDYIPQILSFVICYPDESNDDNKYCNI